MLYMARRFKTATALNFTGLVVAFAACYLLMTQVDYMQSYNCCIPSAGRVYRVEAKMNAEAKWGTHINRPMLELLRQMPQVEAMTLTTCSPWEYEIRVGETRLKTKMLATTREPFAAMQTRCLDGELTFGEGDQQTQGLIIPASLALKLFGTAQVAGRYIWGQKDSIVVRGVYEDFPDNCSMGNYTYMNMGEQDVDNYSEWSYIGYARLNEGVSSATLAEDFPKMMREEVYRIEIGQARESGELTDSEEARREFDRQFDEYFSGLDYRLSPITETYFSGVDPNEDKGNPAMLLVLRLASVLVIVIAAINFLNFLLAESPMRIKGINTRRVLGEGLLSLRLGMMGEAVVTALLACGVALVLCVAVAQQQTGQQGLLVGSLALGDHWGLVALLLVLAVVVGVLVGLYPARFVTGFAPAMALKGSFGLTPKGRRLRSVLVGLQLFISVLMVCYIGILYLQSHYIYTSDYGYDKDVLLYARLPGELMPKKDALRSELMQLPGVEEVGYSCFVLGSSDSYMGWGRADNDHTVTFTCMPVDWRYLPTMGIRIVEGRNFNEHDADCYVINEAAHRQWSWVKMDQPLLEDDNTVVGVCEDVRFGSTRIDRSAEPLAFIVMGEKYKEWGDRLHVVNVRIGAHINKVEARQQLTNLLRQMGGTEEVEAKFLDQRLEQLYEEEFRFIRQVLVFSLICLVITLIGVFCLTMFETEYRRKEIGIRKVFGSTTAEVLRLLCRRYVWLLVVSFVIAVPVAWYIGAQWLQSFAERTPIHWWLFPLALLAVGLVTILTVVIQSWRTANENPVNSIKSE